MKIKLIILGFVFAMLILAASWRHGVFDAGFDTAQHSIPVEDIKKGGPKRDAIPSLTNPEFVSAADASHMKDTERVIGVAFKGEAKAYPLRIMDWHEAVNDTLAGRPILTTW